MNFLNQLSTWSQGYVIGFVTFPIAWYFAKPALIRLYKDASYYVNPILNKLTGKTLPNVG